MKKQMITIFSILCMIFYSYGQNPVELTFTAIDSTSYVQLDSIKIMNRTQGGDTVLYWPDTILLLDFTVGIPSLNPDQNNMKLFQNYPNPVKDWTTINLYIPEGDDVTITITDAIGRILMKSDWELQQGYHSFNFIPGAGNLFFLTAQWKGKSSSIKIIRRASGEYHSCSLEHIVGNNSSVSLKKSGDNHNFLFGLGDTLLFVGYTNTLESGIVDTLNNNQFYSFQFATNIPCLEIPSTTFKDKSYKTIQIFSQCWLDQSLNIGTMILGRREMSDNGILEKYCFDDEADSCNKYGGLYQWEEMMQYTNKQGGQGICPPGWHIPTDEEWKILEGAVDSQYGIGDALWDHFDYNGYDVGLNLKTNEGWYIHGHNGTNSYGFSAKPGGKRYVESAWFFSEVGFSGYYWSSTVHHDDICIFRSLVDQDKITRYLFHNSGGFSVRCLRNREPVANNIDLSFTAINDSLYVQLDSIKVINRTQGEDTTLYFPDTLLHLEYTVQKNKRLKKSNSGFGYDLGDYLLFIGYNNTKESGILDNPDESEGFVFQFGTNIPCPDAPTVTYEGRVYNTIQVFSQCWLKENLNVGIYIPIDSNMSNNGVIEKQCLYDNEDTCAKYGGLYEWDEMMQYNITPGIQGICPPGWHIPTDEEWKILEGAADSQYGIGDPEWDGPYYRGYDAGLNLKSSSGWHEDGDGNDLFGFCGLPGGSAYIGCQSGYYADMWTSTEISKNYCWYRILFHGNDDVDRGNGDNHGQKHRGYSVRCIKD